MYSDTRKDGHAYWLALWKNGLADWQKDGVIKLLLDNKDVILAGKKQARVFVPLCGKAHCLKWFMDMGHSVVGVEFVEDIVREYFSENDLQMEETTCPAVNCKVLQTPDRRLRVFICSIYKFKRECAGLFDIVWDRSGFTAIRDVDRARYAAVLKSLLAPGFSYGMWTLIYDAPWYKLNPRSADETALRKHYGDVAKVTLVDSYVVEQEEFLKGGGPVTYCIWHLTA